MLIFLFAGCTQLGNNDDSESDTDNGNNDNGNNNVLTGPTIAELVNREKQYDYSYSGIG